jgi:(p)ppGpp synthase/HD superfamily hydrolase
MTRAELDQRINERMSIQTIADGAALVARARRYAINTHGSQMYGESEPYSVHLEEVESVLIEFDHISSTLRAAAWLHDVLEDVLTRDEQREAFKNEFPGYLYLIVEAVTSEPGKNRKERNTKTYPKIAGLNYATVVKLADRIANGRKSKSTGAKQYEMYKKEYPEFRAALYTSNIDTMAMWWELDRLFDYQGV